MKYNVKQDLLCKTKLVFTKKNQITKMIFHAEKPEVFGVLGPFYQLKLLLWLEE